MLPSIAKTLLGSSLYLQFPFTSMATALDISTTWKMFTLQDQALNFALAFLFMFVCMDQAYLFLKRQKKLGANK